MTKHARNQRNTGCSLDLELINQIRINTFASQKRTSTLLGRRTVKKEAQIGWLLKALSCIDLTTLSGDDTSKRVNRLCAKAKNPLTSDLLEKLGLPKFSISVGAVCVYQRFITTAVEALRGTEIPIAAVSTGFPAGQIDHKIKLQEIETAVTAGASEIDIVISREYVLTGNWQALYEEMKDFRVVCGDAHVKAILATGDLKTLRNVAKASMVCMMAGADFIKTSTGKESTNATLSVSLTMLRMIRNYFDITGQKVGFKPAGGISTAKDALSYLILMKEELGNDWLDPKRFRIGASSLLSDIERQLEHNATGYYSAFNRHTIA